MMYDIRHMHCQYDPQYREVDAMVEDGWEIVNTYHDPSGTYYTLRRPVLAAHFPDSRETCRAK